MTTQLMFIFPCTDGGVVIFARHNNNYSVIWLNGKFISYPDNIDSQTSPYPYIFIFAKRDVSCK
ncbi:hypothetical protein T4D_2478 [Trichinella pseudospiralis]|uniref:Uncharacterized protein n=1 Tax=Trichinella pseudospiralis TaxID=6337 RepID=A0A0V1FP12_TRIPS|nr:hypothetical protein T4D_2478 [Trichinella pseudospiralis]